MHVARMTRGCFIVAKKQTNKQKKRGGRKHKELQERVNTRHLSLTFKMKFRFQHHHHQRVSFPLLAGCTHLPLRPGSLPRRLRSADTPPGAPASPPPPPHGRVSSRLVPLLLDGQSSRDFQQPSPEPLLSAATHPEPDLIGVVTVQKRVKKMFVCFLKLHFAVQTPQKMH